MHDIHSSAQYNSALSEYLKQFVTPNRINRFEEILKLRTRYISLALEDIYQSHNISAVLRTCECFGIQDVHIIENANKFVVNPEIVLGASNWLSIYQYNQAYSKSLEAIQFIKKMGYKIVATSLHHKSVALEDFNIEMGPFAIFFGTELTGLSKEMINHADYFLKIPLFGFTESFNISVSAGIILHHLNWKLRKSKINWHLSQEEKLSIMLDWLKKSIRKSNQVEEEFKRKIWNNSGA